MSLEQDVLDYLIKIQFYFEKLQLKMQEIGNNNYLNVKADTLSIFHIICSTLDEVLKLYTESQQQYYLLEEQLIKYEAECRNHIRIEQRLKIHCEQLQELCDDFSKQEQEYKNQIAAHQKDLTNMKKDFDQQKIAGRGSAILDKIFMEQQRTLPSEKKLQQPIPFAKKNPQVQLRISRKKHVHTEDYLTMQQKMKYDRSKQSYEERQYSSLEKIQDIATIYSRPKSKLNVSIDQKKENKRSVTLHIQPYRQSKKN
ncbi:hypothetical protein pb186bvf_012591 [Paramecium bursaria]